jgi:hypothetical protein
MNDRERAILSVVAGWCRANEPSMVPLIEALLQHGGNAPLVAAICLGYEVGRAANETE